MRLSPFHISFGLLAVVLVTAAWASPAALAKSPVVPMDPQVSRGVVTVEGQRYPMSYARYQGSTYVSASQLMAMMNTYGLQATTSKLSVSAAWLGQFHPTSALVLDGRTLSSVGSFTIHGSVYGNLSALAVAMRWRLNYQAATGTLRVRAVSSAIAASSQTAAAMTPSRATPFPTRQANVGSTRMWGTFQGVPITTMSVSGKTYMSLWYVLKVLRAEGYSVSFVGGMLEILQLPSIVSDGTLMSGSTATVTTLLRFNGQWYAPLSAFIEGLGFEASTDAWNDVVLHALPQPSSATVAPALRGTFSVWVQAHTGAATTSTKSTTGPVDTATFLLQDGSVSSVQVPSGGVVTQVSLPGTSAVLMGYTSTVAGWIGSGQVVNKSTAQVTLAGASLVGKISGAIQSPGASVTNGVLQIRDVATHDKYSVEIGQNGRFTAKLPYGVYEVWSIATGGQSAFVGSRFIVNSPSSSLGDLPWPHIPIRGMVSAQHCVVLAQNADVPEITLVNIARMFERVYHQVDQQLGLKATLPVTIQVFGSGAEFTQHFSDESYDASSSSIYGQDTQAVTEGPQWIAIDAQGLSFDEGINVLAHELTHAILASSFASLPTWLNEGLAWHEGLTAELGGSPLSLLSQGLWWSLWRSPIQAAASNQLQPLLSAPATSTRYNVEAQDNYAVEQLIRAHGFAKLLTFLHGIPRYGESNAFQKVYQQPESQFATNVDSSIESDATLSAPSLEVSVRTVAGVPSELFVSDPAGTTFVYSGVNANTTYAFSLNSSGQVVTPTGLALVTTSQSQADGNWDIGSQVGQMQSFFSIHSEFGRGYLDTTDTFPANSDKPITSLAAGLPVDMELIAVGFTSQQPSAAN